MAGGARGIAGSTKVAKVANFTNVAKAAGAARFSRVAIVTIVAVVAMTAAVGGLAAPARAGARDAPVDTDERLQQRLHTYFEFWGERNLSRSEQHVIFRSLHEVRREVGRDLDAKPDHKFPVVVTRDATFQSYSGMGAHVAGLFDGKIHIPVPSAGVDERRLRAVLWHEYAHAVIFSRTGNRCPPWLNEGFAEYVESKVDPTSVAELRRLLDENGKLPYDWAELDGVFRARARYSHRQILVGYQQAFAVVHYLFERYRKNRMSDFIDEIAATGSFEQALEKTLHLTPERLERHVVRHLERLR